MRKILLKTTAVLKLCGSSQEVQHTNGRWAVTLTITEAGSYWVSSGGCVDPRSLAPTLKASTAPLNAHT